MFTYYVIGIFVLLFIFIFKTLFSKHAGSNLIPAFCRDMQVYKFESQWRGKAQDTYNSLSIGMSFKEVDDSFKSALNDIKPLEDITSNDIPANLVKKYFPSNPYGIDDYVKDNKATFEMNIKATRQIFEDTRGGIKPILLKEEQNPDGKVISIYRWDLNLKYITSQTNGQSVSNTLGGAHTSGNAYRYGGSTGSSSTSFNAYTAINAITSNLSHSETTEKAYIELTFEDGKMVKREQKGLFDV